jgi:hypothetical protein
MVAFFSLFLSLITGVHPVTVSVGSEVTEVELMLDGSSIAVIRAEPWTVACDFGAELVPHELTAIARNAQGRETSRAVQWINLPRPRSEIRLVVEPGPEGQPARNARLHWESIDRHEPDEISVTFNGEPIRMTEPRLFELPAYELNAAHLVIAKLRFGSTTARTELVLGGGVAGSSETELTAVPVSLKRLRRLPEKPEDMTGWFRKRETPLKVAAIELGPSELIIVHDISRHLRNRYLSLRSNLRHLPYRPEDLDPYIDSTLSLADESRLRVLFPVSTDTTEATQPTEMFPVTPGLAVERLGLYTATALREPLMEKFEINTAAEGDQKIADAVAVAGLVAATGCRSRAVVLLTSAKTRDNSSLTPAQAEAYLRSLHVPLVVWSPSRKKYRGPWGEAQEVSTGKRLGEAASDVRSLLDRQVVIWLVGRHLPQQIELSPRAEKTFRLIGGTVS